MAMTEKQAKALWAPVSSHAYGADAVYIPHFGQPGGVEFIIALKELIGISEATTIHLLEEIECANYIALDSTKDSRYAKYDTRTDYFLENDGYEALLLAENTEVAAEDMKYRKVERQEDFIRLVKVIKSGAWLIGIIISVGINIYFILKFWLKLF